MNKIFKNFCLWCRLCKRPVEIESGDAIYLVMTTHIKVFHKVGK